MEKQIDILEFLSHVVEENTQHYQSDFAYDIKSLLAAAMEQTAEKRCFYWMSRPCGTWCVLEREAFLRDTVAHAIWTYYANASEGIKAYRIVVNAVGDNELLIGDVYPLNYQEQVRRVIDAALPVRQVSTQFQDGTTLCLPHADYLAQRRFLILEHGEIEHIDYVPESESELAHVISMEHRIEQQPRQKRPSRAVPIR